MGGFGALAVGLRNPHLFIALGSLSGYLDYARGAARSLARAQPRAPRRRSRPAKIRQSMQEHRHTPDPRIGNENFDSLSERSPQGRPFTSVANAASHDPFALIAEVADALIPHIYLSCGTADTLWSYSHEFASLLLQERLPFSFQQEAGTHDHTFRDRALRRMVAVQLEVIHRALTKRSEFAPGPPHMEEKP
jgi:S-formylglutathione hydrolase FrmB